MRNKPDLHLQYRRYTGLIDVRMEMQGEFSPKEPELWEPLDNAFMKSEAIIDADFGQVELYIEF